MAETNSKPKTSDQSASPAAPPPLARLLTKAQVMAALNAEIASASLTKVAERYSLSPQEISNIRAGRAGLSKRVLQQLSLRLHELYERMPR